MNDWTKNGRFRVHPADAAVWLCAAAVTGVFVWILGDLLWQGLGAISWEFLTAEPRRAGREGGIGPILISTGLILAVCLTAALPLGLGTAVWLAEFAPNGRFAWLVRRSLDILAGVPSIVFGLFGGVFFCQILGLGFSILSGGLTLSCMVLPLFIRSAEEGLRSVPAGYRLAAAALGFSPVSTAVRIVLPSALPGIGVALVLSVGRALAETAALIFTSGYVMRTPGSLFDSGRSLTVHIYDLAMNVPGGETQAAAAAVVLIVALTAINQLLAWPAPSKRGD